MTETSADAAPSAISSANTAPLTLAEAATPAVFMAVSTDDVISSPSQSPIASADERSDQDDDDDGADSALTTDAILAEETDATHIRALCARTLAVLTANADLPSNAPLHLLLAAVQKIALKHESAAPLNDGERAFVREFLLPLTTAILSRHYHRASAIKLVVAICKCVAHIAALHLALTLPTPLMPLPQLTQLPRDMIDVPTPPYVQHNASALEVSDADNKLKSAQSTASNIRDEDAHAQVTITAPPTPDITSTAPPASACVSPQLLSAASTVSRPPSPATVLSRSPTPFQSASSFISYMIASYAPNSPPFTVAQPLLRDLDGAVFDALDVLLDKDALFYNVYGLEEVVDELNGASAIQHWRVALHVNDHCDVHYKGVWRTARVTDENHNELIVAYDVNNAASSPYASTTKTEWISRYSTRLAPFHSRTRYAMEVWRTTLHVGSPCDALDTVRKWYSAHVVESRHHEVKISYDGWTNKYDEWIHRSSERLAQFNTRARGGKESGGVELDSIVNGAVNDAADNPHHIAVWRGHEHGSMFVADVADEFGRAGGFELILQRIVHRQTAPLSIAHMKRLIHCFAHTTPLFTRQCASRYITLLRLTAFDTILDLNDTEMRQLSKDAVSDIHNLIELALRRIHSVKAVSIILESFELNCALKRFRSSNIERRVNGMAQIQEAVNAAKRHSAQSFLSSHALIAWIDTHNILEDCFSSSGHDELIKRAADIYKFFTQQRALTHAHLDLIWRALQNAIKRGDESKLNALHKLLDDVAWQLEPQHIHYLFSLVQSVPYNEYTVATLDLIRELTKWTHKAGAEAAKTAMSMLWSVVRDDSGVSEEIVSAAIARLEESMRARLYRVESMEQCAVHLKDGHSTLHSMTLLLQIIDTYPDMPNSMEDKTKSSIIEFLNENFAVVESWFIDLKRMKTRSANIIQRTFQLSAAAAESSGVDRLSESAIGSAGAVVNAANISPSVIDACVVGSYQTYIVHIRNRLGALYYLLLHSLLQLTQAQLDALWFDCHHNSFTATEREYLYRFLRHITHPRTLNRSAIVTDEQANYIFHKHLLTSLDVSTVSLPYYQCIEQYFLHVNDIAKHIRLDEFSRQAIAWDSEPLPAHQFMVSSFVDLIGLDALWRIALESDDGVVADKAIAIINRCHEQLSSELKPMIGRIRGDYISACLHHLNSYIAANHRRRALRCVSLLHNLLDASEARGLGGLRAHRSLSRGSALTLTVQNNNIKRNDAPNKISLSVHRNDTLFDIRDAISLALHTPADQLKLFTGGKALSSEQLSQTLSSLHIRHGQTLLVTRRAVNIPRAELLIGGDCAPALTAALTDIYSQFCHGEERVMSRQDMHHYILACGAGHNSAGDERIRNIFEKHGIRESIAKRSADERAGHDDDALDLPQTTTTTYTDDSTALQQLLAFAQESLEQSGENWIRFQQIYAKAHTENDARALRQEVAQLLEANPVALERFNRLAQGHDRHNAAAESSNALSVDVHPAAATTQRRSSKLRLDVDSQIPLRNGSMESGGAESADVDVGAASADAIEINHLCRIIGGDPSVNGGYLRRNATVVELMSALANQLPPRTVVHRSPTALVVRTFDRSIGDLDEFTLLFQSDGAVPNAVRVRIDLSKARFSESSPRVFAHSPSMKFGPLTTSAQSSLMEDTSPQLLSLQGFIDFYREACIDRPDAVWNDLKVHGFRADLRKEVVAAEEAKADSVTDAKTLPRFILTSNDDYVRTLFACFQDDHNGQLTDNVWSLLQRLPTAPTLYDQLSNLSSAHSLDWRALLPDHSPYELLYALQLLDALTEPVDVTNDNPSSNDGLLRRELWCRQFISSGGFEHVYQVLIHISDERNNAANGHAPTSRLSAVRQQCLSLALKLMYAFLSAAISAVRPTLTTLMRFRLENASEMSETERMADSANSARAAEKDETETPPLPYALAYYGPKQQHELAEHNAYRPLNTEHSDTTTDNATTNDTPPLPVSDRPPAHIQLLGRTMTQQVSAQVLSHIDLSQLLQALWRILLCNAVATRDDVESDVDGSSAVIDPLLNTFVLILLYESKTLFSEFYANLSTAPEQFISIITCAHSLHLRSSFANAVQLVCTQFVADEPSSIQPPPHSFLLKFLIANLPAQDTNRIECAEFFWLLTKLLHSALTTHTDSSALSSESLLERLATAVSGHQSCELASLPERQDTVLQGLMLTLTVLLTERPKLIPIAVAARPRGHDLLRVLFDEFLFPTNKTQTRAAHSKKSRSLAFGLLEIMATSDEAYEQLLCFVQHQQKRLTRVSVWDHSPDKHIRSSSGFIGLRNLGSTCYMNSLLQQLYMMPLFRANVLSALPLLESTLSAEEKTDNLLYQLQRMFVYLTLSERSPYDTAPFCFAYKDERGAPINVRIQQDAQEFFNVLFDRLERCLKPTPAKNLIKLMFGGDLINQVVCHGGCGTIRESAEPFYCLSLQVKNRVSITDSLNSYVLGEEINDFNCPYCQRRVDITKRACLGVVQSTIVFHLKRFEFNFETFQHEKLNNKFSFPARLNVEPFTKEGLHRIECERLRLAGNDDLAVPIMFSEHDPAYYQYQLVGILVHTGNAQGGHYFSYCRSDHRLGTESDAGDGTAGGDGVWLEFNDNIVRPFDVNAIEEHCYGGDTDSNDKPWTADMMMTPQEKIKNAYMLVYERTQQHNEPTAPAAAAAAPLKGDNGHVVSSSPAAADILPCSLASTSLLPFIPPSLLSFVEADNEQLAFDRQIFTADYFHLIVVLLKLCRAPANTTQHYTPTTNADSGALSLIQMAVTFAFDVLMRCVDNKSVAEYSGALARLLSQDIAACEWLLDYLVAHPVLVSDILLACRDVHVRCALLEWTVIALRMTATFEREVYDQKGDTNVIAAELTSVERYVLLNLSSLADVSKHWMRFAEYFQLIYDFACGGAAERALLIRHGAIGRIADIYLGECSPLWDKKRRRPSMGNMVASPQWTFAIQSICLLARVCTTHTDHTTYGLSPVSVDVERPIQLSDDDCAVLKMRELYGSTLSLGQAVPALSQLIVHWAFENDGYSSAVIDVLMSGIKKADHNSVKPYFDVINYLVQLSDSLLPARIEWILHYQKGVLHQLNYYRHHTPRFTAVGIRLLMEIAVAHPVMAVALKQRRAEWLWMDSWMRDYCGVSRSRILSAQSRAESRQDLWTEYESAVARIGCRTDALDDISNTSPLRHSASRQFASADEIGEDERDDTVDAFNANTNSERHSQPHVTSPTDTRARYSADSLASSRRRQVTTRTHNPHRRTNSHSECPAADADVVDGEDDESASVHSLHHTADLTECDDDADVDADVDADADADEAADTPMMEPSDDERERGPAAVTPIHAHNGRDGEDERRVSDWPCPICTFINSPINSHCAMCDTANSA